MAPTGPIRGEIANAAVSALKQIAGKGPTKARAMIREETVIVVMHDCLTDADRRLVASGHAELVRAWRQALHELAAPRVAAVVESSTGRRVRRAESVVNGATEVELFLLG